MLEQLLVHVANQGIKQAVICSSNDGPLLQQSVKANDCLEVKFIGEQLPVGTTGAIRDAAGDEADGLLLVFLASVIRSLKINMWQMLTAMVSLNLTVMFNLVQRDGKPMGEAVGIYICETSVSEHIPKEGYFSIREGLILKMLRYGEAVHMAVITESR